MSSDEPVPLPGSADEIDPRASLYLRHWIAWTDLAIFGFLLVLGPMAGFLHQRGVDLVGRLQVDFFLLFYFPCLVLSFLLALRKSHRTFIVRPGRDEIEHRLGFLGDLLQFARPRLRKQDVVEVLFYPGACIEFALVDGRSVLVASTSALPAAALKATAERAAAALGTTVRVVTGAPPMPEEIREIGREARRLRAAEAKALVAAEPEAPAPIEEEKPGA